MSGEVGEKEVRKGEKEDELQRGERVSRDHNIVSRIINSQKGQTLGAHPREGVRMQQRENTDIMRRLSEGTMKEKEGGKKDDEERGGKSRQEGENKGRVRWWDVH
jgi:hypothetical protein